VTSSCALRHRPSGGARDALARAQRASGCTPQAVSVALVERELESTEHVLAQTDLRLAWQRMIPDRRISLVDHDACPIRMGSPRLADRFRLQGAGRPHQRGLRDRGRPGAWRPGRASLLDGAITKAKKVGMQVRSVYADRGFGTSTGDAAPTATGSATR
jgi:hypothetical protein